MGRHVKTRRKKFERAWDLAIRIKQLSQIRPLLEAVLAPVTPVAALTPELPRELIELTRLPLGESPKPTPAWGNAQP